MEGLSDRQFLISLVRLLADEGDAGVADLAAGTLHLHPGYGASSMSVICPRLIRNGSTFAVLLDRDEAGNQVKQSLEARYRPPNEWFRAIFQVTDPEYEDGYFNSSAGEHELEDLFGSEVYSSMVNRVFATLAQQTGPFDPRADTPPSMLKKAARTWLESAGQDPDLVYMIADQFEALLQNNVLILPHEVKQRFSVLLSEITEAARPP